MAGAALLAIIGRFSAKSHIEFSLLPGVILVPLLLGGCVAQSTQQAQPNEAVEQQDQIVDSYHNINIQLNIGGMPTTGQTTTMAVDLEGTVANTPSTMTATEDPLNLSGLTIHFKPEIWIDTAGGTERAGAGASQTGGDSEAGQKGEADGTLDLTVTP